MITSMWRDDKQGILGKNPMGCQPNVAYKKTVLAGQFPIPRKAILRVFPAAVVRRSGD
jgi:hypothetical protein